MNRRKWIGAAALLMTAAVAGVANAQTPDKWPSKPVQLIVPFPPGGTTDIVARLIAEKLSSALGQQVIVDNRMGAGGSIGTELVTKATDGHTIGMGTVSTLAVNPVVYAKLPYDPTKDLVPITNIAEVPNVMSVNAAVKAADLRELIALAKSRSIGLAYGSAGNGSVSHLMGEVFKASSNIDLLHVPYKGMAPALNDTLSGQVQILFDNLPSSLAHIRAGRLRALAVASPGRVAALPNVPTFAELGMASMNDASWFGLVAPAKTPAAVISRLQSELAKILSQPDVRERLAAIGATPIGNTPSEFAAQIATLLEKNRNVAKRANIRIE